MTNAKKRYPKQFCRIMSKILFKQFLSCIFF